MRRKGIRVYLKFFDFCFLNKLILKIKRFAVDNNISIRGPVFLPTRIERYNILRSPHVNKKSRDQLEIKTHKRIIDFFTISENFILKLKNIFFYFSVDFIFKIIF